MMIPQKTFEMLGVRIDAVTREELPKILTQKLHAGKFYRIATVNPEFLVEAKNNPDFKKSLEHTDLNVCDGAGIAIFARILHGQRIPRIPGVEVAEMVCHSAAELGKSVFFLGGFGVAPLAAEKMKEKFSNLCIAGTEDGSPQELSDTVKNAHPDIVFVAFGAPAQELWLQKFADKIPNLKLGIGVGGTFDFWAGKVFRAPKFLQKIGLEWLWRLFQEPRKRARRIFNAVIIFPWLVIKEKFRTKN